MRSNLDWDKGKAVERMMKKFDPERKLLPIYLGDDRTDEDAFLALRGKGITVLVVKNRRRTNAEFYLRGSEEVLLRSLTSGS